MTYIATRKLIVVLAAVALALGVSACGKSKNTSTTATTVAPAASTTTTAATSAGSAMTVNVVTNAKFGRVLVDASSGMTLYNFDKDANGSIACTGTCATRWPPLVLAAGRSTPAGPQGVTGLAVVARPDGGQQVTYQGKPQYRFAGDSKAGDVNGDGVGLVWHVTVVR